MDEDESGEDIDDIDVHPIDPTAVGSGMYSSGLMGRPPPIFVPSKSTPLEDDEDDERVPPAALWAMKYRRHFHFGSRANDVFRAQLGEDSDPVYVLDDGANHHMICREVGVDDQGLAYYLIGRITLGVYEHFANDEVAITGIFSEASDLSLCSVYEATREVSNVLLAESYRRIDEVPTDYLPSNPLIRFSDEPPEDG